MAKVPTEKQKRKLANLMEQLDWFFGVSNQERYIVYCKKEKENNDGTAADIIVNEKYQRITIHIYPLFWDSTEDEQREYITHEYTHYLINPVQKIAEDLQKGRLHTEEDITDAVEKSTSGVAIMIDALLSGHRRYMIKAYKKYLSKTKKKKKKKANAKNTRKIKKRNGN